jgi:hypothetical protein
LPPDWPDRLSAHYRASRASPVPSEILFALLAHGADFVNASFSVDPAKGVKKNIELAGIVADNDKVLGNAVLNDAPDQGAFSGNLT